MEETVAAKALASLGNETRLRVFRKLMEQGQEGLIAGDLARAANMSPSAISFHLGELDAAGLVISWRVGRTIRFAANLREIRALLSFLVEECCFGDPQVCGDLLPLVEGAVSGGVNVMSDKERVFNVLFLCTGNSARSIMAECILDRLGQGRFKAYSAGSRPREMVNPETIRILKQENFATASLRSKSWDEFGTEGAPKMDFVFTVCDQAAAEVCPVWPGQPMTAHWGVPDPVQVTGSETDKHLAFADAMRFLRNRISIFVSLPMRSLDRLTLQKHLDEIGVASPDKKAVEPA